MSHDLTTWLRNKYAEQAALLPAKMALQNLGRKLGSNFRMFHQEGLTRREKARRKDAAMGWRSVGSIGPEGAAAMIYLKKRWGFKSNREAATVAMLYLAKASRNGLESIDLEPD